MTATPPSWRPDLREPADLVEEVLRLEGLESIPSVLPQAPAGRGLTAVQKRRRAVGKSLALNGYVEILPTPFLPAGVFDQWGLPPDDPRRTATHVLNPLESDRPAAGHHACCPGCWKRWPATYPAVPVDVALFAIEQVVEPTSETRAVELCSDRPQTERRARSRRSTRRCPNQPEHVGLVLAGLREPAGPWGPGRRRFTPPTRSRRSASSARAASVELTVLAPRTFPHLPWHPGRCADSARRRLRHVGYAGNCTRRSIERSGLPKGTCAVELNLDAIPLSERLPAPSVSPFPAVFQDVALIVDAEVAAQNVVDAVREGAGELLEDVRLFDVYTGPQIGEGRKSIALALRFRAVDRTLTEDEASAARDAAVANAAQRVGAEQRR